jgi:oligosaccharide biosynthesis protein Alg14
MLGGAPQAGYGTLEQLFKASLAKWLGRSGSSTVGPSDGPTYRRGVGKQAEAPARPGDEVDVLLVTSAGGHLLQMHLLREAWAGYRCAWVTLPREDARSLLAGERVFYAHWPTTRNVPNLVRNLVLAWRLVARLCPKVIVTTGAGVAVPFAWIGRVRGARVLYVESLTRVEKPSLSCRLVRPVTSRMYVQWPELRRRLHSARYAGTVIG